MELGHQRAVQRQAGRPVRLQGPEGAVRRVPGGAELRGLHYLQPSATRYLTGLSDADRETYLAAHPFITWSAGRATFTWDDFLTHVGARKKDTPAFDAFDLSAGENNEFGAGTTESRHFTAYGAQHDSTGLSSGRVAADIPEKLHLMNPMYHLVEKVNDRRARHWRLRLGTNDSDTSHVASANLAARAGSRSCSAPEPDGTGLFRAPSLPFPFRPSGLRHKSHLLLHGCDQSATNSGLDRDPST